MYNLSIKEVIEETKDTVSVSFNVPDSLAAEFNHIPGQYLTLEVDVNGETLRRAYSLCSNPFKGESPKVAVKRVEGGKVSNYINDNFQAGQEVKVLAPLGKFVAETAPYNKKHYVLCAGGSGITPVMSILKAVLSEEVNSRVSLIYVNRNLEDIVFKSELDSLISEYSGKLQVVHYLSSEEGRMDGHAFNSLLGSLDDVGQANYFMCGPQGFMEVVEDALTESGVDSSKINKEYFSAKESSSDSEAEEVSLEIVDRNVVVVIDDEEKEILVTADSQILEAAIDNDLDPPYSCQAGVCTTCRCKLVSGKVHMDEMEGLSEEEIEEGYVLACQAHPLTDNVKVEFSL